MKKIKIVIQHSKSSPIDRTTLLRITRTAALEMGEDYRVLLDGRRGHRGVTYARQMAQFLCRERGASLMQIADLFGKRDHVSVIYNCRRITAFMDVYPHIRSQVEDLRRRI